MTTDMLSSHGGGETTDFISRLLGRSTAAPVRPLVPSRFEPITPLGGDEPSPPTPLVDAATPPPYTPGVLPRSESEIDPVRPPRHEPASVPGFAVRAESLDVPVVPEPVLPLPSVHHVPAPSGLPRERPVAFPPERPEAPRGGKPLPVPGVVAAAPVRPAVPAETPQPGAPPQPGTPAPSRIAAPTALPGPAPAPPREPAPAPAADLSPAPPPEQTRAAAERAPLIPSLSLSLSSSPMAPTPTRSVPTVPGPEPVVHITIGRIELKAAAQAAPVQRRSPDRRRTPALDEYLHRRAGGS